jgi:predicted membrane chloride channel (bestrophin family)
MTSRDLPVLPFWQARSFWAALMAVIAPIAAMAGINWPWVSDPATVDRIMQVVGAISAAIAWQQRTAPNFRLGLRRS